MKEKKKKRGGKRVGSGRKPSGRQNEAVTVYTDVSRFGGRAGARIAIYEFLDGVISKTGETKFLPLDLADPKKKFPPSDNEIKQRGASLNDGFVKTKKIGAIKSDGAVIKDLTKPTSVLNPQEPPKTNFSINTKPRTLDELKALCPHPEKSDERSNWVREERQKYGI